ncbi:MAG: hypothetical protein ACTSR8_16920 [Promethearchaeota archaeon]
MPKKNPKEKRLKHNPKLSEKKKPQAPIRPYEEPYEYSKNYTPLYMAVVFIAVIVIIALLFAFFFNAEAKKVQKYDEVKLDYDIYTLEQYEDHKDPEIHKTNKWVNCCSRYDDDCEGGLIQGFYEKLLGKKEGDIINYELIKACKDDDKDGKDDKTGEDALSYGFESDKLYDTDIVIWAKVLEINKTSDSENENTEAFIKYYENSGIMKSIQIFQYILFLKRESIFFALSY